MIVHGQQIHRAAKLTVEELKNLSAEDTRTLCALIRAAMESNASVCALRITLTVPRNVPAWLGELDVSISMGEAYEGKPLLVLNCSSDQNRKLHGSCLCGPTFVW